MKLIDYQYLATPFYGSCKIAAWLVRQDQQAEVFDSTLVETTIAGVVESLAPKPLRIAEPKLNIAPILSQ